MDQIQIDVGGGYDRGYLACPMFWPDRPGSLLLPLEANSELSGGHALDVGCGEGTNAAWLASKGYAVQAVDVSNLALEHAASKYPRTDVRWTHASVVDLVPDRSEHDIVVAYGLLHCIPESDLERVVGQLQGWTAGGALLVVVAFNDRSQDLGRAHPGFSPTLRSHDFYLETLAGWDLITATDTDLHETHPDTLVPHHHSMTRIVARKPL